MYNKYLYYQIKNGTYWDDNTMYTGGLDGLKEAEDRLYILKKTHPKAEIRSILTSKKYTDEIHIKNTKRKTSIQTIYAHGRTLRNTG